VYILLGIISSIAVASGIGLIVVKSNLGQVKNVPEEIVIEDVSLG
jgi:hypothetical protein